VFVCRTIEVPATADSGVSSGEAFAGGTFLLLLGVEEDLEAAFFNLDFVVLGAGARGGNKDGHRGDDRIICCGGNCSYEWLTKLLLTLIPNESNAGVFLSSSVGIGGWTTSVSSGE
jgi:hypothetical protein